jgi:cell division protein FtsB
MRKRVKLLLALVTLGAVVFLFVLPARTWLQQSSSTGAAEHRIKVLSAENKALSTKVAQLHDPSYIEQVAREQYGLVKPGEKAFSILPPVGTTTTVPASSAPPSG